MRKITNEELGRPSAAEFAAMEKMPVAVVLDNVRSLRNVGAFFRTCDAFAAERICLCGITATPPNRDIHKTALGAELTVPIEQVRLGDVFLVRPGERIPVDGVVLDGTSAVNEAALEALFDTFASGGQLIQPNETVAYVGIPAAPRG